MSAHRFGLLGAAAYIAPRHMQAITSVGGKIVAACDTHDGVGILDRYFDTCKFCTSEQEFLHYCKVEGVQTVVICTPNYMHCAQAVHAMERGFDVLCEKPMGITMQQLSALKSSESRLGKKVSGVLQLRYDAEIDWLKSAAEKSEGRARVIVEYVTRRGPWYDESWKANPQFSGGLLMNIGVHFMDALLYIFGHAISAYSSHHPSGRTIEGTLELLKADVEWRLSIDRDQLPGDEPTHRMIRVEGLSDVGSFEVSSNFDKLHQTVYEHYLAGDGWGILDCWPAIELVERLNNIKQGESRIRF